MNDRMGVMKETPKTTTVLSVEIPLHKPIPKYEKDQLVDAVISDMGYIHILRKPFVIPWDTSLVEFDHVINIHFTVF